MSNIYISDYHHINNLSNRKQIIYDTIDFLLEYIVSICKLYRTQILFVEYPIAYFDILNKSLNGNFTCKKFLLENDFDNDKQLVKKDLIF